MSPKEHELRFPLYCSPVALSSLHETGIWICWPLAFASLDEILFLSGYPPSSVYLRSDLLIVLLGFGFGALPSFTLPLQWLPFYETNFLFLKIPIGFLFPIACATPFPSSLCAKELKGFGFPPWPPRIPPLPYSCLSLQIAVFSIYPTEHCRPAQPGTGFPVKQLQPHFGNRIMIYPPCALCLHKHHGRPQWSHTLPISVLLSLELTDIPERTELHSASSMVQGKKRVSQPISLSLSVSLHQLLANLGHSWLTHISYVCWTCASDIPHLDHGLA